MIKQTYGFDGYMRAWWYDPRLAYNESASGFGYLNFGLGEADSVWKPTF